MTTVNTPASRSWSRVFVIPLALATGWLGGWSVRTISIPHLEQPARNAVHQEFGPERQAHERVPQREATDSLSVFDRLHAVFGITDRNQRARAIAGIADNLDVAQISAALEQLKTSHIPFREEAMSQLYARWGETDPAAALEFAENLPRSSDRTVAVNAVLNAWMDHDPAGAEGWVQTLPAGSLRSAAWQTVIIAYAAIDRDRAIELAQQIELPWSSSTVIAESIFGAWTLEDPRAASARAAQLPEGWIRTEAQNTVAKQWAESDPEGAIAWAISLPDRLVPERVEIAGLTTANGADRTNTVTRILEPWLMRDSEAVVRWFSELPDDPWRTTMISLACNRNAESARDPRAAVTLAALLPEGEQRYNMLCGGAGRIAELDPKSGLAMLSYATDNRSRLMIMDGLARELKGDDLLAALQETQGSEAPKYPFTNWADPENAAKWAVQHPGAEPYLRGSTAAWMVKDPDQAAPFVQTLSPPLRDSVYSSAVKTLVSRGLGSPEESVTRFEKSAQWIPQIGDPALRQTAYRKLAERWLGVEPESGRSWVEMIPIAPEVKAELLKQSRLPN